MSNSPGYPGLPGASMGGGGGAQTLHHVCFGGHPECSGCNPCPGCLQILSVVVFTQALGESGIHPSVMPVFQAAYQRGLDRLHLLMKVDPNLRGMYQVTALRIQAPQVVAPAVVSRQAAPPPTITAPVVAPQAAPQVAPPSAMAAPVVAGSEAATLPAPPSGALATVSAPTAGAVEAAQPPQPPQVERPIAKPMTPEEIATAGQLLDAFVGTNGRPPSP